MGFFDCEYLDSKGAIFGQYRCNNTGKLLDSATATGICMSSQHTSCEDYNNTATCFITTAVCLTMGKPDNCEELTLMRRFRDEWLRDQPDGAALIEDYYQTAPAIVEKINQQPNRKAIYQEIYQKHILPCVESVKAKRFADSKRIYVNMVAELKEQYA